MLFAEQWFSAVFNGFSLVYCSHGSSFNFADAEHFLHTKGTNHSYIIHLDFQKITKTSETEKNLQDETGGQFSPGRNGLLRFIYMRRLRGKHRFEHWTGWNVEYFQICMVFVHSMISKTVFYPSITRRVMIWQSRSVSLFVVQRIIHFLD